jgi:phosphoribosyl-dephospho-CoA transferase
MPTQPCQKFDNPQVHDLLQLDTDSFDPDCISAPDWAKETLAVCPWVVVRRAEAPDAQVAAGVRGTLRSQRWGWFIRKDMIRKIVRPSQLLALIQSSALGAREPPFTALQQIVERWRDLSLPWGPTGSVGFELATGCPVTTKSSDLDIAIRAKTRISVEQGRSLWERTTGLQTKLDIRVETPICGFGLQEYAYTSSAILLRYPDGPRMGVDPWSKHSHAFVSTL